VGGLHPYPFPGCDILLLCHMVPLRGVKRVYESSVLFVILTTTCESTIISKSKVGKIKQQPGLGPQTIVCLLNLKPARRDYSASRKRVVENKAESGNQSSHL
jgi:hypothetical protein